MESIIVLLILLILLIAIGGLLRTLVRWSSVRDDRHRMPFDVADDQRRVARNGMRTWLGMR